MSFDLFKGYIITNNKKAAEKFKNVKKLKTYDQFIHSPKTGDVVKISSLSGRQNKNHDFARARRFF